MTTSTLQQPVHGGMPGKCGLLGTFVAGKTNLEVKSATFQWKIYNFSCFSLVAFEHLKMHFEQNFQELNGDRTEVLEKLRN